MKNEIPPNSEQAPVMDDHSKIFESLKKESWPFPGWSEQAPAPVKRIKDYEDYFTNLLRTRYTELESEFQITIMAPSAASEAEVVQHPVPKRIFNLLLAAKQELERQPPNLLSVSSTLELVDRYLIWLYHPSILQAKIPRVLSLLENHQVAGKEKFIEQLSQLSREDLERLNQQFEAEITFHSR